MFEYIHVFRCVPSGTLIALIASSLAYAQGAEVTDEEIQMTVMRQRVVSLMGAAMLALVFGCQSSGGGDDEPVCEDGGQTYAVGENWGCSDGCNSCSCLEGGSVASTDLACIGECTPEECGPAPGMPNDLCEDGETTAGPGDCERQDDGSCGWTIVECPEPTDPCDDLDCQPCVDGQCLGEDEICEPGEWFDAADGCNSCECPESGIIAEASCTEMACIQECGSQADCADNQFCDFPYDACGIWANTTMAGTCMERPEMCDEGGVGACGCDGSYALNPCELQSRGADYQKYGACLELDTSESVCGTARCNAQTEFCEISINDVMGADEPEFYNTCASLPDGCEQGDCSCMGTDGWAECFDHTGYTFVVYPGG